MWPRTKQAYAEYEERVRDSLEEVGWISTNDNGYIAQWCDICGLGEQRIVFNGKGVRMDSDTTIKLQVCEDCDYYLEYGRLDDVQMSDIESSDI
jgi:hypothetical protein